MTDGMTRHLSRLAACAVCGVLWTASAHAQQAAAAAPAAPAAAPAPQPWHGAFNAGGGLAAGVQEQRTLSIDAQIGRAFREGGRVALDVGEDYSRIDFPTANTLANRTSVGLGVEQELSARVVLAAKSMYLRDELLYVESRFEQLAGVGGRWHNAKKTIEFEVIPGVTVYKQDLKYSDDLSWRAGVGVYESLKGRLNDQWSIENAFRIRRDLKIDNTSVESSAAATASITKALGLQLGVQYNYESTVPPDFPNYLFSLTAGFRVQF